MYIQKYFVLIFYCTFREILLLLIIKGGAINFDALHQLLYLFPFDITISLSWFPLLYPNFTPPGRRGRGIPARPQARLARLFCCRTLRRTELCCDSQKASTQGTVEQSRTQTGSHQTRQVCVASIPDVYGRVHVWEGCCIGIHYTIRKFVVNIWSARVPYHYCFHYFHSYTNCILTTIHPFGNLNRTTQCLIVS